MIPPLRMMIPRSTENRMTSHGIPDTTQAFATTIPAGLQSIGERVIMIRFTTTHGTFTDTISGIRTGIIPMMLIIRPTTILTGIPVTFTAAIPPATILTISPM
jgi:hypothetical protein